MSKVLVIVGSPRKGGNTETLADAFIKGAVEAGNHVEKVNLRDTPVKPCVACDYCMKHPGECAQKDGMQNILKAVYSYDVLVLATPLYTFGFSAQIKAVLDRFYVVLAKPFNIHSSVLLTAYGDDRESIVAPLITHYNMLNEELELKSLGIVAVGNVMDKGDIKGNKGLADAESIGKSIV